MNTSHELKSFLTEENMISIREEAIMTEKIFAGKS